MKKCKYYREISTKEDLYTPFTGTKLTFENVVGRCEKLNCSEVMCNGHRNECEIEYAAK